MCEERSCQKIPTTDECKRELLHFYQSFILIMNDEDQIRANDLHLRNRFSLLGEVFMILLPVMVPVSERFIKVCMWLTGFYPKFKNPSGLVLM